MATLQDSFGPEATPYQAINHTPPEFDPERRVVEKQNGAPEVLAAAPKEDTAAAAAGSSQRRICGLRRAVFWVLLAVGVAIVLGVGVGVGVGVGTKKSGSNKSNEAKDAEPESPLPSTSSTQPPPSGTSSAAPAYVTSGTHGLAANSCNSTTPSTAYVNDTAFTQYCYVDWPSDSKVKDVGRSVVYTFEDCMGACVKFNTQKPKVKCAAVTYIANLTEIIEVRASQGNCFLKDKKGTTDKQGSAESASAAMVVE